MAKKIGATKRRRLLRVGRLSVKDCVGFVWDGCHKIYVCKTEDEFKMMRDMGYEELIPMSDLEYVFTNSCPLRFISWADLHRPTIVPQCAGQVTFAYSDGKSVARFRY